MADRSTKAKAANGNKDPLTQESVFRALFDTIAEKGFGKARLSLLAQKLKVSLSTLYKQHKSIDAILSDFMDTLDNHMVKMRADLDGMDKRDIYFDLLMGRFEMMQTHRAGLKRWLEDLTKQPQLWPATLRRWEQSLSLLLDLAGDSPVFPVKKLGLAVIYAITLRTWLDDETKDLAKTMAVLDQCLEKAGRLGSKIFVKKQAAV